MTDLDCNLSYEFLFIPISFQVLQAKYQKVRKITHCLDNANNIMYNYDRPKYQEEPTLGGKMWTCTIPIQIANIF